MRIVLAAAALAVAFAGSAATAATVGFEFGGGDNSGSSLVFNSGGVTVTVTSAIYNPTGNPSFIASGPSEVTQQSVNGLGVCSGFNRNGGCAGDNQQLDGNGLDELLIFTFSEAVSLLSIDFRLEGFDNFDLLAGNSLAGLFRYIQNGILVNNGPNYVVPGFVGMASIFAIANPNSNDQYRVGAFTVETATVPVPAAGLMLLAGLGGIAAMRRRKSV